ncbi:hypothetical protein GQ457_05G011320 [Hibiscus cannabinus]
MESPKQDHWIAAKRILRYVKGTLGHGLFYKHSQDSKLVGYSDSDYGGDIDDRKSTSGYLFHIGSAAFSWSSKKQQTVALSTCEAEYIAAAACTCQAIWLKNILDELNFAQEGPTTIYVDNKSTISLAKNPVSHSRSKHIVTKYHFIREQVKNKNVELVYCKTEDQLADIFTKPLVLMGNESCLRSVRKKIMDSTNSMVPIEVVGLDLEEGREAAFDEAVDKAWKVFGFIDSFVNCYAYEGKMQDHLQLGEEELRKIVKINFMAAWFLLKAVGRRMRDGKSGGSIVFMTMFIGAERGLYQGAAAYGSCMAGVQQLVRASTLEIGKQKIRVNAIARGLHLDDEYPRWVGKDRAEKLVGRAVPLRRWLDVKNDLASTVIYLVTISNHLAEATFVVKASSQTKKTRPQCSYCSLLGHTKEKCYKLHGYPPGYKSRGGVSHANAVMHSDQSVRNVQEPLNVALTTQQCQQLIAMLTNQLQTATQASTADIPSTSVNFAMQGKIISYINSLATFAAHNSWIVDSGASKHVYCSKDLFESLYSVEGTILLPDKSIVSVAYSETVRLSSSLVLRNVLFVPQFQFNLLSVSSLIGDSNLSVLFCKSECLIQDLHHVIGKGEVCQGLYLLQPAIQSSTIDNCVVSENVNFNHFSFSWHDRLGHPSDHILRLLKDVLPSTCNKNDHSTCTICPLAKQRCLPFPVSSTCSKNSFELVHCDVWGPFKDATYDNHRFFLTLVDDFTRSTWTYLMQHKSDVLMIVPSFLQMVKRQFGHDIKMFRSDNAPELKFSQLGIVHQFSCVETPQQNSVVERKHQHLLAVARALFFQSRVPIHFWGDCVLTATYIINRLPTLVLQNKSPYEVLHAQAHSFSNLGTFGCLCFVSTLKSHRNKFSERALPAVFLGYVSGIKGFKVFVLKTQSVMVSRNVVFHEHVFPFHSIISLEQSVNHFASFSLPRLITENGCEQNQQIDPQEVAGQFFDAYNDSYEVDSASTGQQDANSPGFSNQSFPAEAVSNANPSANPGESASSDNSVSVADGPSSDDVIANEQVQFESPILVPFQTRKSSRVTQKPSYLKEYFCNSAVNSGKANVSCNYPIEDCISTSRLTTSYMTFVANISSAYEPSFFHQAVKFPEWRTAMDEELQAMENLKTWSVVPLPAGKRAIACKWVYRIKRKADGTIDRYKARLVAKGFTQIEGIDFIDTFSPVAKMTTFKVLLALAAVHNWHLLQLDVNNAFLNGILDEEVYMQLPLGYKSVSSDSNMVCKLHKSIYGLKQASRQWFHAFSKVILNYGFVQSPSEHSLFVKGAGDDLIVLLVYVDDIVLAGKNLDFLKSVQSFLQQSFKLKELGSLKYFLGFEIARNETSISLSLSTTLCLTIVRRYRTFGHKTI